MIMVSGEEKAWQILQGLDSADVCRRAAATFDEASGSYTLRSFGKEFIVSPLEKRIWSHDPGSDALLHRLGYFFNLSVLCYLNVAKDIALTGRLINPANVTGGQLFFRGTHVLPVNRMAEKYGHDMEAFVQKGSELDGKREEYGDASFRCQALPRIPVFPILWKGDEEFPPRADLLLDSSCELQLPLDIIWSVSMMTVLVML